MWLDHLLKDQDIKLWGWQIQCACQLSSESHRSSQRLGSHSDYEDGFLMSFFISGLKPPICSEWWHSSLCSKNALIMLILSLKKLQWDPPPPPLMAILSYPGTASQVPHFHFGLSSTRLPLDSSWLLNGTMSYHWRVSPTSLALGCC